MLIFSPFLASKKVYALDPQGITFVERKNVDSAGTAYTMRSYQIPAVWFSRRSNGRKAAFFVVLWDSERTNDADGVPAVWDLDAFIANCDTGRYGGTPLVAGMVRQHGGVMRHIQMIMLSSRRSFRSFKRCLKHIQLSLLVMRVGLSSSDA